MSVWDTSTPAGSEAVSAVDDRIREMKNAVQDALRGGAAEGTEAIFPGNAPTTAPIFRYRGLKGSTSARGTAGQFGLYFNTTLNTVQRDNGSAWEDVATLIPGGGVNVLAWFQASPPVGWTQITSHNDKALRVVSGTGGGSGGVDPLSTPPSTAHTHSIASANTDHKHLTPSVYSNSSNQINGVAENPFGTGGDASSKNLGTFASRVGGQASSVYEYSDSMNQNATHDHGAATGSNGPTAFAPKYIDMILASKD